MVAPCASRADAGIEHVGHVLLRYADAQAADTLLEIGREVRALDGRGCGVERVVAADRVEDNGGIADGAREGADLVERACESDETETADAAVGGLDADDAAEGGGLADAAAGIGAERVYRLARSHGGGRTAGGAAGD